MGAATACSSDTTNRPDRGRDMGAVAEGVSRGGVYPDVRANPVRVDAPLPLIPAHSASKTRVNALMLGIQSIPDWVPAFAGTSGPGMREANESAGIAAISVRSLSLPATELGFTRVRSLSAAEVG